MRARVLSTIGLLTLAGVLPARALADTSLPKPQTIEYRIRADPDDANSAVALRIIISLIPESASGNSVSWWVAAIQFRHPGTGGAADLVWTVHAPTLATSNGLWAVTHADPSSPLTTEFAIPPRITGYAGSSNPLGPQLQFDFEGHAYTPPLSGPPFGATVAMDYEFGAPGLLMISRKWHQSIELIEQPTDPG